MTGIIAVAGLVIFTVLVSAWNHREGRKWKRARVLSSFGQKPEEGERPSEQTRILWEKTKTENGLDDITWSDLDQNEKERQELLEANDERGRYIALKTRAAMYRIVYWLLSALTLGAMAIGLIMDDNDTKLAFMLLFFIWLGMSLLELAVRAYYRNKE